MTHKAISSNQAPVLHTVSGDVLIDWVRDTRRRTLALVEDLSDEQLLGPRLSIVNPMLWELGHIAWFHEKWVLRHATGQSPLRGDADSLYDSAAIPHDVRWDLPLLKRETTLGYMRQVLERVLERLQKQPNPELTYFVLLSVFHEDMHGEAFLYTRQTLGCRQPRLAPPVKPNHSSANSAPGQSSGGSLAEDVEIPGGLFQLGASEDEPFMFDNEKWAHAVQIKPFAMARAPVTQMEYAAFVEDEGYRRSELWTPQGWSWLQKAHAEHPVYWRHTPGQGWSRRHFDQWLPLEPNLPVIHVNWYEADAYCRWAGRRLPTEAEWEFAAAAPGQAGTEDGQKKWRFPWGNSPPNTMLANLDALTTGTIEVSELPEGDSAWGCRQMIGNVWEWTVDDFQPYPGFVIDPYKEYSQPWFGTHKVLRGGCWVTRGRLLRNTWRNFYTPDRRDIWAGFRTCARR